MRPMHSVLMVVCNLNQDIFQEVESLLRRGIKVMLFAEKLSEYIPSIENYPFFAKAAKHKLFQYWNLPDGVLPFRENMMFMDGRVTNREVYAVLCSRTDFNSEQFEIEHFPPDKHLTVSAGAGTGKTTTLMDRIFYLKHLDPDLRFGEMALITFTNEAAVTMRIRLTARCMDYFEVTRDRKYLDWLEETGQMSISTIHSFAKQMLSKAGMEIGIPDSFKLRGFKEWKRAQTEKLIDAFAAEHPDIYDHFESIPHYLLVQSILSINEQFENRSIDLSGGVFIDFGEDPYGFHRLVRFVLEGLHRELEQEKRERMEWEIADLIRQLERLRTVTDLKKKLSLRFLMIDEFQDTDPVQVRFVLWLQKQLGCRILAVGDVKQSIYRFRGADYTAFQQLREGLEADGEPVAALGLVKNYRSSPELLRELNPLFEQWGNRLRTFPFSKEDRLQAMSRDSGAGLVDLNAINGELFSPILRKLHGTDTAILVRTNREVRDMVARCEEFGFFCEGETTQYFFQSLPVREMYQVIHWLLLPHSAVAAYAVHRSSYGENTLSNRQVLASFTSDQRFVFDLLRSQPDFECWERFRKKAFHVPVFRLLEELVEERNPVGRYGSRLYRSYKQKGVFQEEELRREVQARMKEYQLGLDRLMILLRTHFSDSLTSLYLLEQYLRIQIATNRDEPAVRLPDEERGHRFRCMTVHKAKGLEFDYVVIPWVDRPFVRETMPQLILRPDEGKWKAGYQLWLGDLKVRNTLFEELRPQEHDEWVGEEARLLYVAMTRAKKALFIELPDSHSVPVNPNSWRDLLKWRRREVVHR
jgi:DNA helicase-2/ATP-dependent DNA helicase PcrA